MRVLTGPGRWSRAAAGRDCPALLRFAQELVCMPRLDLPRPYPGPVQELLHRGYVLADGGVEHTMGDASQHVLGKEVLLIRTRVLRAVEDARGSKIPHYS